MEWLTATSGSGVACGHPQGGLGVAFKSPQMDFGVVQTPEMDFGVVQKPPLGDRGVVRCHPPSSGSHS